MNVNTIALEQTTQILASALVRFAKEEKGKEIAPFLVKIIIGTKCINPHFDVNQPVSETNPDADFANTLPYFYVIKNNVPFVRLNKAKQETCEVTMNQILNVKLFDALGRGQLANTFLSTAISRFSTEQQTDPRNIEIMICFEDEKNYDMPTAFLYDLGNEENAFVKKLDWEKDIFVNNEAINKQIMEG